MVGGSISSVHELDDRSDGDDDVNSSVDYASEIGDDDDDDSNRSKEKKMKFSDFEGQLNAANNNLRASKKLAGTASNISSSNDGILSNKDFQRIRELKAKKDTKTASTQHGLKLPSSDQLRLKRVDAATLERHIKKRLTKEEKSALGKERREDRPKYQSRSAIKKKKIASFSNREKERKKLMPYAARKAKIARSRQEKKMKQKHSSKQFRGRKAWK